MMVRQEVRRRGVPVVVEVAVKRATIVLCASLIGGACSTDAEPRTAEMDAAPAEGIAAERQDETDAAAGDASVPGTEARRRFGQLPMRYEENRGQHDARARYVGRQGALTLFATDAGPVLAIRVPEAPAIEASQGALGPVRPGLELEPRREASREPPPSRVHRLRIALEEARENATIEPSEPLVTRSNYFLGDDPTEWRTDIPNYGALRYRELAPGVDLVLHGSPEGRIEYDLVVAPGTAPELSVRFEGAERVRLGDRGTLEVHVGGVVIEQPAPVLYQEIDGRRVAVEGGYRVPGLDRVRFEVGPYDRARPLVIDPVLVYGTYLGGSSYDYAHGVAVDGAGAAYVTGYTQSTNFPTASPYQPALAASNDVFVAKLTPSGDALAYATYLGGSSTDLAVDIAVDGAGAAYVTGYTQSTNFPTRSPYQSARAGGDDAFVAKLTPAGDALAYATYLGGSGDDVGYDIAVDGAGAAYVTGYTVSTNFPTRSPCQPAHAGGFDGFVAKLTPAGDTLAYGTYLGGSGADLAWGIAVDGAGAAYVTGDTSSSDFPTVHPFQLTLAGGSDAFVAKLTPSGDALAYATYLGGSRGDAGHGIAVDGAGAAYVTGDTNSTNFPTASPYQPASAGAGDTFVAKLTPSGDALAYATYLGGSSTEFGYGIAVDGAGAAYVTGDTISTNFPTRSPYQPARAGGWDSFVAKLTPAGDALAYATYLGGSSDDHAQAIAVDGAAAAYITGYTVSTNFPTRGPYQPARAGGADAFVAKLGPDPNGASCAADSDCASGFCTDGVCCDARCGGGSSDCQACAIAAGAATDGTCGPSSGNACDDGLGCTTGTTCSAGACAAGTSPCSSPTSCSEAGGGSYTCSACPAGTSSADGTGASACTPCAAGTWSAAAATSCTAWSDCAAGTHVSTAGTPTTDRACSPCPDGTYSDAPNASSCTSVTMCTAAEYESVPPSSTSDRVCGALTACTAAEYESAPPSPTSDRVCSPVASCDAEEYEVSPPSPTSDRACAPYAACQADEYESEAPTATSDRVCSACTVCGAGEVEVSACSTMADRVCQPTGDGGGVSDGGVSMADAGSDAGTDPEPSPSGCGCAVPGRGKATSPHRALGLLGALVLALSRRRRRARV